MIRTHSLLSPRFAMVSLAAAVLVGLALAAALSTSEGARADSHVTGSETLVVTPSEAHFEPGNRNFERPNTPYTNTGVWIYGSGFTPQQSVIVIIADKIGVATDIGALAGVDIVANEDGAFGFKWNFGRFAGRSVGLEAMYSIRALDGGSFDTLTTAPLALCNLTRNDDLEEGAEAEAVPGYCSS